MRILIANYRYFISSGPERYLFNLQDRLETAGHQVIPLSVRYRQNISSPYERYFVSPIGGDDEIFFDQHRVGLATTVKGLSRLFYSREVEHASARIVEDTKPDVAYVLYYLRKMSPALLVGLKKRGVPIVARISDYGMMCGEHHMLRNDRPCTLCLDRGRHHQIVHRCVKGSLAISAVDALATAFHHARGYFDLIDRFVTTNAFMTEMMIKAGIGADRIVCNPTFTELTRFSPAAAPSDPPYLLYVGRLDRPKGLHILIEAMRLLREQIAERLPSLKIAGDGHDASYVSGLKSQVAEAGLSDSVAFLGSVSADQVPELFRHAYCSVMPVLWYENLPNSVIESFASGCPVVGADIGSLSSTITHGIDGLHHQTGDAADLARQLRVLIETPGLRDALAKGARATAEQRHAPDQHIARLLALFGQVSEGGRNRCSAANANRKGGV